MAAVSSWSKVQADLTPAVFEYTSGMSMRAYAPKKQTFTYTQNCWGGLMDYFFENMKVTAQKRGSEPTMGINLVTIVKDIEEGAAQMMALAKLFSKEGKEQKSDGKASEKTVAADVPVRFGLSGEEQLQCMEKAKALAIQWFTEKCVVLPQAPSKKYWMASTEQLKANTCKTDPAMHCFFYKQCGLRRSQEPYSFSKADLAAFGIKDGEKISDPSKMNCVAFALLKTRELRAKDHIFYGKEPRMKDLPTELMMWGYKPVETPQPKDLVMYIDADGHALHLGRFLDSGQVESKIGREMPYIHWHNIFDVSAYCGNRVVFMRKG